MEWFAATHSFECAIVYLLAGKTWSEILGDYNVSSGRYWTVDLPVIFRAPVAVKHLESWNSLNRGAPGYV